MSQVEELRVLEVDTRAIEHNLKCLQKHLGTVHMMVVVKNNGYGCGLVPYAQELVQQGVRFLGVASVDELIQLREAGIREEIAVIHAAFWEAEALVHYDAHVFVGEEDLLQALADASTKQNKVTPIHLFINTGMNRFGCQLDAFSHLATYVQRHSHLDLEGLLTHFVAADDPTQDARSHMQKDTFFAAIAGVHARYIHTANTAAAIRFPQGRCNLVRTGLGPLGVTPSMEVQSNLSLSPAVSLRARIVRILTCQPGDTISYGGTYRVREPDTKVAVLSLGYGDGLRRLASANYQWLLHGNLVPTLGVICMDYTMVDVTAVPDARTGDWVTLFGTGVCGGSLAAETQAVQTGVIPHELITSIGPRVQRNFI